MAVVLGVAVRKKSFCHGMFKSDFAFKSEFAWFKVHHYRCSFTVYAQCVFCLSVGAISQVVVGGTHKKVKAHVTQI